jgi:hypothetical protein
MVPGMYQQHFTYQELRDFIASLAKSGDSDDLQAIPYLAQILNEMDADDGVYITSA